MASFRLTKDSDYQYSFRRFIEETTVIQQFPDSKEISRIMIQRSLSIPNGKFQTQNNSFDF